MIIAIQNLHRLCCTVERKVISSLLLVLFATNVTFAETPGNIGERLQLFVDSQLIDRLEGAAKLRLHKPVRRETVIVHDKPWEGNTCAHHTVFKDGDDYRMYYRASDHKGDKPPHPPFICYAESRDGVHWIRPNLGLIEFNGSKENNIMMTGERAYNFTPFKDTNPDATEEATYKAIGGTGDIGLYGFQSSDGIHWSPIHDEPILTDLAFDSQNLVFWDTIRSEYRAYIRAKRRGVRDIKTTISENFLEWEEPSWLRYPGAPKEHLYTNQIQPYPRAPHIFIGFPSRYLPDRGSLVEGLLMSSRDGKNFHRWQEAIIRPGLNPDRWHNRSNYIGLGLVETQSDLPGAGKEFSLYSSERYSRGPGVVLRRYTYRIDGFVSLHAPMAGGNVLTKPFTFSGSHLLLNLSTSAAGTVRVAVLSAAGEPIAGFQAEDCQEIYGDEIERVVKWTDGKDMEVLSGQPIRLIFELKDADLYAFRFGNTSQ